MVALILLLNAGFLAAIAAATALTDQAALRARLAAMSQADRIGTTDYPRFLGWPADRFSDCVLLSLGLVGDESRSVRERLRDTEIIQVPPRLACETLAALLRGESVAPLRYGRYWNGHQILVRPLLMVVDITTLRHLAGLGALTALLGFVTLLNRDLLDGTAAERLAPLQLAWLITAVLLTTGFAVVFALFTHALALGTACLTALWPRSAARAGATERAAMAAAAGGATLAFMDNLFAPTFALAAMLAATAASGRTVPAPRRRLAVLAAVAAGWVAGHFGTLACRAALDIALAEAPAAAFRSWWSAATGRIVSTTDGVRPDAVGAIGRNLGWMLDHPAGMLLAALTLLYAAAVVRPWRRGEPRPGCWALLLPLPVALGWYVVFNNHSQVHAFFTFRALGLATVLAVLAVLLPWTGARRRN
jgi:hypothetical protein